jgi:hypothetical protein
MLNAKFCRSNLVVERIESIPYITNMWQVYTRLNSASDFFQTGRPILNSTFFKSEKSKSVVQRPKIYQKNLPKKVFQDGGYFQNGVCTFFLYENMSCDRYFSSIELVFGLSQYFLMFNYMKIYFRFLDHPNIGLPYKILVN